MEPRELIDLHAHILYDLDDGARNRNAMMQMFRMARDEGIRRMVATPHFIAGANRYDRQILDERLAQARELLAEEGIDLTLELGQELFLDEHLPGELRAGRACTLAGTRYLLVEFPLTGIPGDAESILAGLLEEGYLPVIAHPERYREIQQDPDLLTDLIELGCLTQLNAGSLTGRHGRAVQETARTLLASDMVHLVGTDCHSARSRSPKLRQAWHLVVQMLGETRARHLFVDNPRLVLDDVPLTVPRPRYRQERKPLLNRLMDMLGASSS